MRLAGLNARFLEPESLRAFLRDPSLTPGKRFTKYYDAARFADALVHTHDTGTLSDEAACALADCVLRAGENAGFLDVDAPPSAELTERFVSLAGTVLGGETLARQLLEGGLLDRRGVGEHIIGSLPLRVVQRQATRANVDAARKQLRGGWDEDLINLLESAALRAERMPEEHLVLVPSWSDAMDSGEDTDPGAEEVKTPQETQLPEDAGPTPMELLGELAKGARDLVLSPGLPPQLHGAFGQRALGERALTPTDTRRLAYAVLTDAQRAAFEERGQLVTSFGVQGLGRFRLVVSLERGAVVATFRALGRAARALPECGAAAKLTGLKKGLVLVGGAPASGRSATLSALLQHFAASGRGFLSLEEPLGVSLAPGPGSARQVDLGLDQSAEQFARLARQAPEDVVGIDLVDDALGAELALDAAADGRLVFLVLRGLTVPALIHRVAVLDAKAHRRRLSENLAAVLVQKLEPDAAKTGWKLESELLLPSEALRRHLRAQDTPPPPVVLEDSSLA